MKTNQYARRKFLSTISAGTTGAMLLDPFSTTMAQAMTFAEEVIHQ